MTAVLAPPAAGPPQVEERIIVTQPGVYDGLPNDVYHGDPVPGGSLSYSGAKRLLPPSCPARFKWERDNGRPPKPEFDFGHAAHKLVLGVGDDLVLLDVGDFKTKAAREERDAAYAAGKVPITLVEYAKVEAMAAALRAHPVASALFDPDRGGKPEQSLFWADRRTGVKRRARFDWLPAPTSGRMIIPDYKTAKSADPSEFDRAMHAYAYHQQSDWYRDGAISLGLCGDDAMFVFVVQEKDPPYVVTVIQPDQTAMAIGRLLNREAIDIYRKCVETDNWPGYSDDVEIVGVPRWVERRYTDQELFA